jgi:hypothetical protein
MGLKGSIGIYLLFWPVGPQRNFVIRHYLEDQK